VSDNELDPVTPLQRFTWQIAKNYYSEVAGADFDSIPAAEARLAADRLRDRLGDLLRIFDEHFQEGQQGEP
jgi:protein-disulfide isomerase-like protein with CxxC motif